MEPEHATIIHIDTEILKLTMRMKEELVARAGAMVDIPPSLQVWRDGGLIAVAGLDRCETSEQICSAIEATIALMAPDEALFTADAWMIITTDQDKVAAIQEGQLEALFAAGDPSVFESILIIVMRREGSRTVQIPYQYANGKIMWRLDLIEDQHVVDVTGSSLDAGGGGGALLFAGECGFALAGEPQPLRQTAAALAEHNLDLVVTVDPNGN